MDARRLFQRAWRMVGATGDAAEAFEGLRVRHAAPSRHYHTMAHVLETIAALRASGGSLANPAEAELALWYHDAVYDPARNDNEEASAELATHELRRAGVKEPVVERISAMILDTRHSAPATTADGALVADADLATLGAAEDVFDAYNAAIRQEYAFVPEPVYRAARAEVLRKFLDRPAVYQTRVFRRTHETGARTNLARALARLQAGAD